jgi:lysophospholipase L1-like esterase
LVRCRDGNEYGASETIMRPSYIELLLLLCPICVGCSDEQSETAAIGGSGTIGGASATGGNTTNGGKSSASGGSSAHATASGGESNALGGGNGLGGNGGASNGVGGSTGGATGNASGVGGSTGNVGGQGAGGTTSATTGGKSSGGSAGSATGGSATGGSATGGSSTGGTTQVPACATNQLSRCTGTNPIVCDFGGTVGDYEITLELGGPAAGNMYVEAETHRRMLPVVTTAAGTTKRYSFGVNVRQPEGQPVQNVSAGTPGLQIYVRGTAPQLSSICVKNLNPAPKVWIAGDSTVCDQDSLDFGGWGQHLPRFFGVPVSVANYADSGESSGSVLGSAKMWGAIKAGWKAGDWAFVQLGHNDKDVTAATFKANMTAYVTQAKAAGVNIVLCTPIARAGYALAAEHVNSTGANLPQIIRDIGTSQNVPVIDLTVTTWNWLQTITWTKYFALGTDRTHTNHEGADIIAGFVADAIRQQKLGLATHLR